MARTNSYAGGGGGGAFALPFGRPRFFGWGAGSDGWGAGTGLGRGGTTGVSARTGRVAARWARSARPTLHLVLRAVGGTPQGAVWALLAHGGARERGGVRYAP